MEQGTPGGDAQLLRAEALGEPGHRRFRLVTVINDETFILWMEKQQVQALGLAVAQLIDYASSSRADLPGGSVFASVNEETRNQFRVGRIELAFDEAVEQIVIVVHDIEQDAEGDAASLAIRIDRQQGLRLCAEAEELVARGRPICPMCGSPMDPEGHVCPQQNGHLPLSFDEFA
ncbi:MAG TPA: DUF3090 family protein [Thermomicrobiales bacterium]|nr:DUF3090 family protein [Thermomicrobiales bacterium]